MIFSTFAEFKKSFKRKNFSQIYAIKNKPKLATIEKLIELVSLNKDSFIFESVEKVKIRGRYTIFGFNPDLIVETINNRIIQNINNKKKILKKNPYNYFNKLINNFHFKTSKKHLFIRPHQIIPCVHANKAQLKIKVLESRFNGKCFENSGLLVSEHPVFFYSAQRIPLHAILNYCLNVSDGDEVFQSGF